ncbi:MAG: NlpC/P60 family protein [Peptoniphilaceae bacterium]|nr:NlpC/P60 family protein [Peptoniphilaceae bacterium]MDY6019129.1 NlpC/P60 family protein [Anaerococcus sp.]
MNKKNTGATLGVLVAVSIGATAYASAMNNLDKDTYAKNLLENKVSYVQPSYKAKLDTAKANYTQDLANTKIGESEKEVAVNKADYKATLYEALNEAKVEEDDSYKEEKVEANLDKKETTKETKDDEKIEEVSNDESDKASAKEEEHIDEEKLANEEENVEETPKQDDLSSESEALEDNKETAVAEDSNKDELKTYVEKYVAVEYLNVREEASADSQVLNTIEAGSKVSGYVEGDWLKTEQGYIMLSYLQDYYPQDLIDQLAAKKAEAQKKAEEEKKAQQEAQRKAEEEKKAQQEAQRKAEEEKKAQQAVAYTGWVNTPGLNIRSSASTSGKILGNLTKGDKINGSLQNGWIKFTFNGQTGYVNSSFVVNYEVKKPEPVKQETKQAEQSQQNQQAPQQKQAVATGSGQAAAGVAQQFAGYPYVFGASDPSVGFDCSGLVYYAYKQIGVNLARNSAAQFSNGYAVDANNLVPGDLVFFSYGGGIDHVGIITGYDGTFIHASTPGTGVVYGNIFSSHYQSVFRGARRIF